MEEQSDQLEKLKRELAARAGELARAQEALSRTEQVPASQGPATAAGVRLGQVGSACPSIGPYLGGSGPSGSSQCLGRQCGRLQTRG